MQEKILSVISENFPNGVRFDFITDRKIRRLYKEKFGEEIPADFGKFSSYIKIKFRFIGGEYLHGNL